MANFKIDDQTSFELENGEEVIFSNMPFMRIIIEKKRNLFLKILDKNNMDFISPFTNKYWGINIAVTNKRVVAVPLPPNEKGNPLKSFYYTNISGFSRDIDAPGKFSIYENDERRMFIIGNGEKLTAGKVAAFMGSQAINLAQQANAQTAAFSFEKYQTKVDTGNMSLASAQAAYDKEILEANRILAASKQVPNYDNLPQSKNRDFLLQLAFTCWKAAKK